jgi:hypothetical protein
VNTPLDDPWVPDSLAIAPRTIAESHIATCVASWLGDPWCVNTSTREIVGPARQRLQVRLDDSTGDWVLHVLPGMHDDPSSTITVTAVLPPSRIAAAIRLRLLPEYELALARAFESDRSIEAAERRLIAAQADRLAEFLGEGWRRYQSESGIASVASAPAGDPESPPGVHGVFACNLAACDLTLSVEWELAEHVARAVADYVATRRTDGDHWWRWPTPQPSHEQAPLSNGDHHHGH